MVINYSKYMEVSHGEGKGWALQLVCTGRLWKGRGAEW